MRELKMTVGLPDGIRGRISDSGAKLSRESHSINSGFTIGHSLCFAHRLFTKVAIIPEFPFVQRIQEYADHELFHCTIEQMIETWIPKVSDKVGQSISTATTHIASNGSSRPLWRFSKMEQLPR
jgi:hypothetical protein